MALLDVGKAIGVNQSTIFRTWERAGLPRIKIGRDNYVLKADADSFVAEYERQKRSGVAQPVVRIKQGKQLGWFREELKRQQGIKKAVEKTKPSGSNPKGFAKGADRLRYIMRRHRTLGNTRLE